MNQPTKIDPHIYIFIPYYGSFPNYFQLYLDSLGKNENILTIFMITTIDTSCYNLPPNLKIIPYAIEDIRVRISNFLHKEYNVMIPANTLLATNYKLVDFKIIYPVLFDDIMKEYAVKETDYVGWGDIDLIYGKLSNFMDLGTNQYHIIGGFHGHFTAIINNDMEFKTLYKRINNYVDLCTDASKTYIADEIAYREPLNSYLKEKKYKMFYINSYFCDVVPPCFYTMFRKEPETYSKNFFDVYNWEKGIDYLYYNNTTGSLTVCYDDGTARETAYCHLQKRAMGMPISLCTANKSVTGPGYYIEENKFSLERTLDSVIPLNVYTCWIAGATDLMPTELRTNYDKLKSENPEFGFQLFDDKECIEFLDQNYPREFAQAYKILKHASCKSDLWRSCMLYKYGGIYIDLKLNPKNGFKLRYITDKEYFVSDGTYMNPTNGEEYQSLYTGIMAVKPQNKILLETVIEIIYNVAKKNYNFSPWIITGPQLLGKYYQEKKDTSDTNSDNKLYMAHYGPLGNETIRMNNKVIFGIYDETQWSAKCLTETINYDSISQLWAAKAIYNNDLENIDIDNVGMSEAGIVWEDEYLSILKKLSEYTILDTTIDNTINNSVSEYDASSESEGDVNEEYEIITSILPSEITAVLPSSELGVMEPIIFKNTMNANLKPDFSAAKPNGIRLHLPAIPYTITRDEYSHDAFTGKVQRFSPMMRSLGYEVYHYGVETSEANATMDIQLFTKKEWNNLRVKSLCYLNPKLKLKDAVKQINDEKMFVGTLANWDTPLFQEFNKRFREQLSKNYRDKKTDIVCVPLGHSYDKAINGLDYTVLEFGIGYNNSCKRFRVFESYNWMSHTYGKEDRNPDNYWFVVPYFIDSSEFVYRQIPEKHKIGFLGRICNSKGCHVIVEIAKRLPNYQFILCGQGEPEKYLTVSNIKYKKPIHGKERSTYLGSCEAVLCPSEFSEPFCAVAVEAQLCGTPVITSDWGGFVETVEQFKTGVRCHTLADYCYGIELAVGGKFDRQYIRERAQKLYDMYNLAHNYDYILRSILDIYDVNRNGWYSKETHINAISPFAE